VSLLKASSPTGHPKVRNATLLVVFERWVECLQGSRKAIEKISLTPLVENWFRHMPSDMLCAKNAWHCLLRYSSLQFAISCYRLMDRAVACCPRATPGITFPNIASWNALQQYILYITRPIDYVVYVCVVRLHTVYHNLLNGAQICWYLTIDVSVPG